MIDLDKLLEAINPSPEELSKGNKKKIHEYLPVPNDWKIRGLLQKHQSS